VGAAAAVQEFQQSFLNLKFLAGISGDTYLLRQLSPLYCAQTLHHPASVQGQTFELIFLLVSVSLLLLAPKTWMGLAVCLFACCSLMEFSPEIGKP
jgi:hypothetical protein